MKSTIYIIIFILFGSSLSFADDWFSLLNLTGRWKFSIGDNLQWADPSFNDDDWDEVHVPSSWENEGYHGYNGYAWYRKHFKLNRILDNSTIYLQLGYIDDADEVYLNGELIGFSGGMPPDFETAYNAFRKYPIPLELINFNGPNIIAIRVYDSQLVGGIVSGEIGLFVQNYGLKPQINLEGKWKFHVGDNKSWLDPEYNDFDWDEIMVPGIWETQGFKDYNGYAWYRKTFIVPADIANQKLVFVLGKIDDLDEAYLNGIQIGGTGKIYDDPFFITFQHEYQEFRGYYIPKGVLKPGLNTIAVRVYDGFKEGGIFEGPIGIITQSDYVSYWNKKKRKSIWEIIFGD